MLQQKPTVAVGGGRLQNPAEPISSAFLPVRRHAAIIYFAFPGTASKYGIHIMLLRIAEIQTTGQRFRHDRLKKMRVPAAIMHITAAIMGQQLVQIRLNEGMDQVSAQQRGGVLAEFEYAYIPRHHQPIIVGDFTVTAGDTGQACVHRLYGGMAAQLQQMVHERRVIIHIIKIASP